MLKIPTQKFVMVVNYFLKIPPLFPAIPNQVIAGFFCFLGLVWVLLDWGLKFANLSGNLCLHIYKSSSLMFKDVFSWHVIFLSFLIGKGRIASLY